MTMDGVLRLYFGAICPRRVHQTGGQSRARRGFTFIRRTRTAFAPRMASTTSASTAWISIRHGNRRPASGVQALNLGIRCVLNPGDKRSRSRRRGLTGRQHMMANATVRQIPHPLCDGRYVVDFDALEAAVTPRTRLLLYTSPSNPLGWVATDAEQQGLLEFARRHNLWLMADEVYDRLYYAGERLGEPVPSILRKATREDAVMVVHSFSKSYCMTGWRVGWLVARRDLAAKATQLNEFIISHAPTFAQKAGETALSDGEPELERMLHRLKENRDLCLEALRGLPGITVPKPDGAFYLFPRVDGMTDSFGFCRALLEETRVGLAPGVAFGEGGEGSFRICYAAEPSILEPAMERLTKFLRKGVHR